MTYEESIRWLETPDKRFRKADKEDFTVLMKALGDPQDELRFVHVTGSNGKGSICTMLAAILSCSGYRTGQYTSPHLSVYNERCRIDGKDIPDDDLARLASAVRTEAEKLELSLGLFYKMTALSLLYYAAQQCDIVVLEVGRGGRRDCTNIITTTELAVIGSVSLEHTEVLGKTEAEIAREKSGIFKTGADALMLHQSEEAMEAAQMTADSLGVRLRFTAPDELITEQRDPDGQTLTYRSRRHLRLGCPGVYQTENVQLVLDAADILRERGFSIPEEKIRSALASLKFPGRFEMISTEPFILLDGAHNIGAVSALTEGLKTYYPDRRFTFIVTLLWDRPWQEILRMAAPLAASFVAAGSSDPKALSPEETAAFINEQLHLPAVTAEDEKEAFRTALRSAGENGAVCVFGSLYLVGAVRDLYLKHKTENACE